MSQDGIATLWQIDMEYFCLLAPKPWNQQHCPETLKTFDSATLELPRGTMTASQGTSLRTARIGMQQHQLILHTNNTNWSCRYEILQWTYIKRCNIHWHWHTFVYNTSGHRLAPWYLEKAALQHGVWSHAPRSPPDFLPAKSEECGPNRWTCHFPSFRRKQPSDFWTKNMMIAKWAFWLWFCGKNLKKNSNMWTWKKHPWP